MLTSESLHGLTDCCNFRICFWPCSSLPPRVPLCGLCVLSLVFRDSLQAVTDIAQPVVAICLCSSWVFMGWSWAAPVTGNSPLEKTRFSPGRSGLDFSGDSSSSFTAYLHLLVSLFSFSFQDYMKPSLHSASSRPLKELVSFQKWECSENQKLINSSLPLFNLFKKLYSVQSCCDMIFLF